MSSKSGTPKKSSKTVTLESMEKKLGELLAQEEEDCTNGDEEVCTNDKPFVILYKEESDDSSDEDEDTEMDDFICDDSDEEDEETRRINEEMNERYKEVKCKKDADIQDAVWIKRNCCSKHVVENYKEVKSYEPEELLIFNESKLTDLKSVSAIVKGTKTASEKSTKSAAIKKPSKTSSPKASSKKESSSSKKASSPKRKSTSEEPATKKKKVSAEKEPTKKKSRSKE
jgi:hypothetical protein